MVDYLERDEWKNWIVRPIDGDARTVLWKLAHAV